MAPARDNLPIADEVSWSVTSYDRYLNGQADSSREDAQSILFCSNFDHWCDEIDFCRRAAEAAMVKRPKPMFDPTIANEP